MRTSLVLVLALTCSASRVTFASRCWVNTSTPLPFDDGHVYSVENTQNDFSGPSGPYKMLKGGIGEPLTTIEGGAIRAAYPGGKILGTNTGFSFFDIPPEGSEQAWMSYRIKFDPGFEWTKGGKLPGLCGGPTLNGGKSCPTGCTDVGREDGFSTRLMWRQDGGIVAYAYYPDKPRSIRCGEDWVWDGVLTSGRWHDIAMRVTLNSVTSRGAAEDGRFEAWLDGRKVLDKKNIRLRYRADVVVNRVYLTSYVGGSSVKDFAPSRNQHALFEAFKAGAGYDVGSCVQHSSLDSKNSPDSPKVAKTAAGRKTGAKDGAPQKLYDFDLFNSAKGWDVPGYYVHYRVPRSSVDVYSRLRYCHGKCKNGNGCEGFTLYGNWCYLKSAEHIRRPARRYGEGASGWRWYYVRRAGVVDQSSDTPCGDVGQDCCYSGTTDSSSGGSTLCATGKCSPPSDYTTSEQACFCSDAVCVKNVDYCPTGEVCDQSTQLDVCGSLGQPCCGQTCDEDVVVDGHIVSLECADKMCRKFLH